MRTVDPNYSADDVAAGVELAAGRIGRYVRDTPLEESVALSREVGARVFLKLESAQISGSFKARGAFNKLVSLNAAERAAGIVTASTGNHALATAHALTVLGIQGEIFLPSTASAVKVEALRARGAQLRFIDGDPGIAEVAARAYAGETGRVYVSPYNDREVIAGQGTIARELVECAGLVRQRHRAGWGWGSHCRHWWVPEDVAALGPRRRVSAQRFSCNGP